MSSSMFVSITLNTAKPTCWTHCLCLMSAVKQGAGDWTIQPDEITTVSLTKPGLHTFFLCVCFFPLSHRLCDLVKLQSSCKKQNLLSKLMDRSGNYIQTALPFILSLLQQGLGQRIHLLTHSLSPDLEVSCFKNTFFARFLNSRYLILWNYLKTFSLQWSVESEAPKYKAHPPLSFGLLLRPELSSSVLERGPPADNPKVTSPYCLLQVIMALCFRLGV